MFSRFAGFFFSYCAYYCDSAFPLCSFPELPSCHHQIGNKELISLYENKYTWVLVNIPGCSTKISLKYEKHFTSKASCYNPRFIGKLGKKKMLIQHRCVKIQGWITTLLHILGNIPAATHSDQPINQTDMQLMKIEKEKGEHYTVLACSTELSKRGFLKLFYSQ